MALDFREVTIEFPKTRGRIQELSATVGFNSPIKTSYAALRGFSIGYPEGEHPLHWQQISVTSKQIDKKTVEVTATMLIRDSTGPIDDPYGGWVNAAVIAEVA